MMYQCRLAVLLSGVCLLSLAAPIAQQGRGQDKDAEDIVATLKAKGCNTFFKALDAGDLVETLKGKGPFTVFAPSDKAFAALPKKTLEDLMKADNKERLVKVLKHHVLTAVLTTNDIKKLADDTKKLAKQKGVVSRVESAKTLGGTLLQWDSDRDLLFESPFGSKKIPGVKDYKVKILQPEIPARNGVVHIVEKVFLLRPEK